MSPRINRDDEISETVQSLRRIVKTLEDYSQQVSGEFGITGPQLWALKTISDHDVLPLGQLSKKMYLHPSTVTGVVDRLESKGYVARGRDATDRRIVTVSLTAAGRALVRKAPSPVQGKMIYGLRKLKRDELHVIHESLRKLVEIVEAENVKVTFFFDKE